MFGAGGYVGRHVRAALGDQAGVVAVPRTRADLAEATHAQLTGLMYEIAPDVVVNCAGVTSGDQADLVRGNVVAVARLLAALATAAPTARYVHVGSGAEYGRMPMGEPVTEDAPCDPAGNYGLTKLAGSQLVQAAAADGLDAVVLRVFNLVGPGAPAESLPQKLAHSLRGDDDLVVGGLEVYRDFVDVRDAARAIAAAATLDAAPPPMVNVGSGRATAVHELVETLVEVARPGARVVPGSSRAATIPWQCADISLAAEALDWRPTTPLRASLEAMWTPSETPSEATA
ncbi:NAD(P)-dependent oxidoreductase [Nonomuraea sp. NBC_01738]|uniref:NAD-dependent epimerase/dehydratase family protein n=1 Tax=Nonomuraea sp. NBC_01738 TaxID=2976003 RepID=UPI002E0D9F54|nr:NAD(P)-dependent oxidoreductase [Nonomuraea sp. NBC_01738]